MPAVHDLIVERAVWASKAGVPTQTHRELTVAICADCRRRLHDAPREPIRKMLVADRNQLAKARMAKAQTTLF